MSRPKTSDLLEEKAPTNPPCALCDRALGNVLGFKARWFCWRCFAEWQKDSFPPSYNQFNGDDAANFEAWFQAKSKAAA